MIGRVNLLTDPVIATVDGDRLSLPGLLAAMARGEVSGFAALRPHQRAAWHMFLVQLAALALWTDGRRDLTEDEGEWHALLRGLTPEFPGDEPWCLTVADRSKPAFLQPPDPGGLKWLPVATPDALDMLITSRNHDLKSAVATGAEAQDWIFALVSLQTSEGYGGAGNHGIARMNGGSSSRPMLALAPADRRGDAPHPSTWWARDVRRLLALRAEGQATGPCTVGGDALLWCLPWPEKRQLDLTRLDPWFIELCRRVRLTAQGAERSTSKAARIAAKEFQGAVGDPWAPVHRTKGKALTLGEGSFTYKKITELLSAEWETPALAKPGPEDDRDMVLVAEALSRGNSKTDGLKTRIVPVPRVIVRRLFSSVAVDLAGEQMADIAIADRALRYGLAIMAARGVREDLDKANYERAAPARAAFDRRADALFFPALWDRIQAAEQGGDARAAAVTRFRRQLAEAAEAEFRAALPGIPCASLFRPRALARAEREFRGRLRREGFIETGEGADDAE